MLRRPWILSLALSAAIVPALAAPPATADETPAERAAREIADAQDQADAAAAALWDAQAEIEQLEVDNQQLAEDVAALQAEVGQLDAAARAFAVNRFVNAGSRTSPLLLNFQQVTDQLRTEVLSEVVESTSADDAELLQTKSEELDAAQQRLDDSLAEEQRTRDRMADLRDAATAEVAHLQEVEAQRLLDEATRKALAAEQARRAKEAADAAARDASAKASASAAAAPPIAAPAPAVDQVVIAAPAVTSSASTSANNASTSGDTAAPTPEPEAQPEPEPEPGGGGGGGVWVCPTGDAAVSFSNTYGASRSGGRSHEGVDMIGARGTPILAVVSGSALAKQTSLGGNSVWVTGNDGNKYFYAHLDRFGQTGAVQAGDVIGYMGDTGNARGSVVHLHFEIHPGGGRSINPYPTVRAHC